MSRGKRIGEVDSPEPPSPPGDALPGVEVVVPERMQAQQVSPSGAAGDAELEVKRLSAALDRRDLVWLRARALLAGWAALHGADCACRPCLDTRRFLLEHP